VYCTHTVNGRLHCKTTGLKLYCKETSYQIFTQHFTIDQEHLTNQGDGYFKVTVKPGHAWASVYPYTHYFSILTMPFCLFSRFTECATTVISAGYSIVKKT